MLLLVRIPMLLFFMTITVNNRCCSLLSPPPREEEAVQGAGRVLEHDQLHTESVGVMMAVEVLV